MKRCPGTRICATRARGSQIYLPLALRAKGRREPRALSRADNPSQSHHGPWKRLFRLETDWGQNMWSFGRKETHHGLH